MANLALRVEPITAESHPFLSPNAWDALPHAPLADSGYRVDEYAASGTARVFHRDDRESTGAVPYTTRVLVIRPDFDHDFSGVVHIELLNPSMKTDYPIFWPDAGFHLMARGDVYLGITCKSSTVDDLRRRDPLRYAELHFEHDSTIWDLIGSVGAACRTDEAGGLLPGLRKPDYTILNGWSQSGSFIRTYLSERLHEEHSESLSELLNEPNTQILDAYLIGVSSGGFGPMGYVEVGRDGEMLLDENFAPVNDLTSHVPMDDARRTILDAPVPVIEYMSEDEAVQHIWHRRPDSDEPGDLYRCYQIPARAHGTGLLPTCARLSELGLEPHDDLDSDDPERHDASRWLIAATLSNLVAWLDGIAPPRASPIRLRVARGSARDSRGLSYSQVAVSTDADGHALGGVRYLEIDLPVGRTATVQTGRHIMQEWKTTPMSLQEANDRYGSKEEYRELLRHRAAELVREGFLLPEHAGEAVSTAAQKYPA